MMIFGPGLAASQFNCGSNNILVCVEIPDRFLANDGPILRYNKAKSRRIFSSCLLKSTQSREAGAMMRRCGTSGSRGGSKTIATAQLGIYWARLEREGIFL